MPILIIEVMLLVIYFGINSYISEKTTTTLKSDTLFNNTQLLGKEVEKINTVLSEISNLTKLMQKDHERIFTNPNYYNIQNVPNFDIASNGVYYKKTKSDASLYYSSKTNITTKEKEKAIFTEAMDPLLKDIVELNPNIVAAYFNSYDDMNRLYPYIEKVYEQYGEHIHMEDYNFYYLADKKHNPNKGVVWTDAYLDPAGNGWMISAIAPIYNRGFLEGVSGIDFTIEKLVSNVLDKKLPFDGKMFLVDSKGMILAMPDSIEKLLELQELKKHTYNDAITETVLKPEDFNLYKNKTPFAKNFKEMIQKNKKISQISINNSKYLALSNKVEQTGWTLFTIIKEDNIFESTLELKNFSNLIGYVAMGFMAFFYILFFYMIFKKTKQITSTIVTPINHLSKLTSTILVGDLQKTESPKTNIREIHQLSTNFNKMSDELEERTKKLIVTEIEKQNKEQEAKKYFEASMQDPLTKLYNRNKVNQVLPVFLKKFQNNNEKIFSIIFLDIDHFKSINDTFGHDKGDEVLIMFAKLLKSNTREDDIVARIGGEEFLVITENSIEVTKKIAEHLMLTISKTNFSIDSDVTSSFGTTEVNLEDTVDSVIKRADEALYNAKSNGRNRVEYI